MIVIYHLPLRLHEFDLYFGRLSRTQYSAHIYSDSHIFGQYVIMLREQLVLCLLLMEMYEIRSERRYDFYYIVDFFTKKIACLLAVLANMLNASLCI